MCGTPLLGRSSVHHMGRWSSLKIRTLHDFIKDMESVIKCRANALDIITIESMYLLGGAGGDINRCLPPMRTARSAERRWTN